MKQLIFFGLIVFFIGIAVNGIAQRLEIDLRTDTSSTKHYVGLAVRDDTFTGHAFVILYQQENQAAEKKDFKVYGYYPKTIATIPIPIGVVKNDSNCLKHIPPNGELYFIVDADGYAAAKEVVEHWTAHPPLFTLLINCIDMLEEVAMSIGVKLPSRYKTIPSLAPEYYMKYLYKKLSSTKGITYAKNYRLKIVERIDELEHIATKPTKIIGKYQPTSATFKWIVQAVK